MQPIDILILTAAVFAAAAIGFLTAAAVSYYKSRKSWRQGYEEGKRYEQIQAQQRLLDSLPASPTLREHIAKQLITRSDS